MIGPPVFTDEDFPIPVAEALRKRGFFVVTTREALLQGQDDEAQLRSAIRLGAILVSHNKKDFRHWAAQFRRAGVKHPGMILLRQDVNRVRLTLRLTMLLQWRASLPEPRPEILIWNDLQQRLIHGLRLPGYSEGEVRLVLGWSSTLD